VKSDYKAGFSFEEFELGVLRLRLTPIGKRTVVSPPLLCVFAGGDVY